MAKKKQPDFQPTKLRVGKHLPKGRNVTNTAFKSKKIITKDQKFKTSEDSTPLAELIRLAQHNNVMTKIDTLKRIAKYVERNASSLASYFAEILNMAGKIFLDNHPKVRQELLNLIKISIEPLLNSQMGFFMNILTSHLNCMMTHVDLSVKKDSLDLLSALLKTHPSLVCHSTKLLGNLLNMISSVKAQKAGDSFNPKKRKLDDNISGTVTSVVWRDHVLKLIVEFLEKLVDNFAQKKAPCEDEQRVYYNGKQPLYLQMYSGSGLTPAKQELSSCLVKSESRVTEELRVFFDDLVNVASDIVTEEIAGLNTSSNSHILRSDNIEHLNTVTQALCCIADWFNMGSVIEDSSFIQLINDILRKKMMKGFCYTMHESAFKKQGGRKKLSCIHLNLGISYLYCSFILGTEYENIAIEKRIMALLAEYLNSPYNQDLKTVSLCLKIIKSFLKDISLCIGAEQKKYNDEVTVILRHLSEMFSLSKNKNLVEELQSFFINISFDYMYKFLVDSGALNGWITSCLHQMKVMRTENKADKVILKCINQICCREYPAFVAALNSMKLIEILDYLKLDDEDFQFTAMNLITHMTDLPPDFLQNISDLILCNDQLSVKTISKLIRLLNNRFLDKRVSVEEFLEFVKFLLNVSFDVVSVEKTALGDDRVDSKEEESLRALLSEVQDRCQYCILPSANWERHSQLVEVCLECLLTYPDRDLIMKSSTAFFSELLRSKIPFPVHSAVALLKLATFIYTFEDYYIPNKFAMALSEELMISSFFYISVVTSQAPGNRLRALGVFQLQNSLCLDQDKAIRLLELIRAKIYENGIEEVMVLYILRIIKYLLSQNKVSPNDLLHFRDLLQTLQNLVNNNSEEHAVWLEIFEYLH